ncbi:response regulator [Hymenobacter caeli]|uniref:CheY-like chemotaxis protein n=1 Tax=Hymenobacter caeli TaxID=2735894 RepID=A0ABX2FTB8_9BACT|nr:response regulator [Hymenobacter caeli]NRT19731.1 CheY-like chemotaxis protein [Hymenobacter caeli]
MPQLSSILLVDDDTTTNFLNQTLIQRMSVAAHLQVAENGAEALQALHQTCEPLSPRCPDLILLDMKMPVMNGIEFLEAYAQLPLARQRGVGIVMLTTSLLPRDLERVQQLPVAGALNKPLTKEKLQAVVAAHFGAEPVG